MPRYSRGDSRQYLSTIDIAEVTGKEHKHIMRDVRAMVENNNLKLWNKHKGVHLDSYKRKQAVLLLDWEMTRLLIKQYERRSPEASQAIAILVDQRRKGYEAKITALVDKFFSKWTAS